MSNEKLYFENNERHWIISYDNDCRKGINEEEQTKLE